MKNLHILPTDKPSRLTIRHKTKELLHSYKEFANYQVGGDKINTNQHIYITSDEEIQEGVNQWYLDKFLNKPYRSGGAQYGEKQNVIILTTDTDLIKDGIQAIDDEFLDWFTNNPSCEWVEVKEMKCTGQCWKFIESDYEDTCLSGCELKGKYKIIIPKEEPKQETFEEAANKYAESYRCPATNDNEYCRHDIISAINFGANWKAKRMYSKKELHKCKYCGVETTQPNDECYAKPAKNMTAVEWLWKALLDSGFEDIEDVEGFYYQALEMEKQQHEETFEAGYGDLYTSFEKYYSETYKKDEI